MRGSAMQAAYAVAKLSGHLVATGFRDGSRSLEARSKLPHRRRLASSRRSTAPLERAEGATDSKSPLAADRAQKGVAVSQSAVIVECIAVTFVGSVMRRPTSRFFVSDVQLRLIEPAYARLPSTTTALT